MRLFALIMLGQSQDLHLGFIMRPLGPKDTHACERGFAFHLSIVKYVNLQDCNIWQSSGFKGKCSEILC